MFYLVESNKGFVVGTDTAVTFGTFDSQTGSRFTNGSIAGPYTGGTLDPITKNTTNSAGVLCADGSGNINGSQETSPHNSRS